MRERGYFPGTWIPIAFIYGDRPPIVVPRTAFSHPRYSLETVYREWVNITADIFTSNLSYGATVKVYGPGILRRRCGCALLSIMVLSQASRLHKAVESSASLRIIDTLSQMVYSPLLHVRKWPGRNMGALHLKLQHV